MMWLPIISALMFLCFSQTSPLFIHKNSTTADMTGGRAKAVFAGNPGNYTLAFVPLFSLIANLIPRIINRFTPVQQTTAGRSVGNENTKGPCSDSIIGRWPYLGDRCMFYQCDLNHPFLNECLYNVTFDKASAEKLEKNTIRQDHNVIILNNCITFRAFHCQRGFIFDPQKKNCSKKAPSDPECPG